MIGDIIVSPISPKNVQGGQGGQGQAQPQVIEMNNHTIEDFFEFIVLFVRHKKQNGVKLQEFVKAYNANPMNVFQGIYKLWSNNKQKGNDNILGINISQELTPQEVIQLLNEIVNNMP